VVLPIIGETLVEIGVIFFGDFFSLFHPDGFVFVELFQFCRNFFYFLFLLVFLVFSDLNVLFFLLLFLFVIRNLFFGGLFNLKRNGE